MQILLPPSEGKTAPADGAPVDLDALSFTDVTGDRVDLMSALVMLCRDDSAKAAEVLGLGPTQAAEIERNTALPHAPAAPARDVYTGVLYDALGLTTLPDDAAGRATRSMIIISSVFGAVRPGDRIPAYRLGGGVRLPGIGPISTFWRQTLRDVLTAAIDDDVVFDLRSTTYASFWRPRPPQIEKTITTRVLHDVNGARTVVSHHNKATKGHLLRGLMTDAETDTVTTPQQLADVLRTHGWTVELAPPDRAGRPWALDVVVTSVPTT